ncbi:hypothetical protein PoB_000743500 [Plakobranchus ocellatus]|uniref:Uncharacterized protein n=1 Tax=Plakobranchus ocellatus TaxID=259542 RepID=A0AAV3YD08_9GAST|nr:hypothetical protein PoB_000743500 [Plakobranchus ocellatus]
MNSPYTRLSGTPSGQGFGSYALTHNRRFPTDLRADSLSIVPTMPPQSPGKSAQPGILQPNDLSSSASPGIVPLPVLCPASSPFQCMVFLSVIRAASSPFLCSTWHCSSSSTQPGIVPPTALRPALTPSSASDSIVPPFRMD